MDYGFISLEGEDKLKFETILIDEEVDSNEQLQKLSDVYEEIHPLSSLFT